MLIGLGMNAFFPFICQVKYAITRHAPLTVLQLLQQPAIVRRCALSVVH
jgi:hypothetical protein